MSVLISPGDVAADHAGLLGVAGVVGAVQGEVAQRGDVPLDAVEVAGVGRGVGQLDVVGRRPGAYPGVPLGAQVRAGVVQHDRQADLAWIQGAHVAQECEQLVAALACLDVAVEPVP
jgi:hypothetical protein